MKKGTITVVLPIYNTEAYLDQCIQSVVDQSYTDLEIILVDDGSTDHSPQICECWAEKDPRIRVIHKINEGVGMARNTGIEVANGDYICFFDSDDHIAKDTIEKAYGLALKEQSELVLFGLHRMNAKGQIDKSLIPKHGWRTYQGREVQEEFLRDCLGPDPNSGEDSFYFAAWLFLYSMELIKRSKWRFVSERDIISEDTYSLTALMKDVQRVSILPEALYFYRFNTASLSRKIQSDRCERIRTFYVSLKELCETNGYSQQVIRRSSHLYFSTMIAAMKQLVSSEYSMKKKWTELRNVIDDPLLQQTLQESKHQKMSVPRKLLFFALRHRFYSMAYLLLWLKAQRY